MANKRILVVDDDSYVREATEEILTRRGVRCGYGSRSGHRPAQAG